MSFSELTYSLRLHTHEEWISIQEAMEITVEMFTPQNHWYLRYDSIIDDNVAQCIEDLRVERETIHHESQKTLTQMQAQQNLSAGVLAIVVLSYAFLTTVYMVRPLGADVQLIAGDKPLPLKGAYELQYLANAYNAMYEQRRERDILAAERAQALERLRSYLK